MKEEIKVGDAVRLKSGGPDMTVSFVRNTASGEMATCDWVIEGVRQHHDFRPEMLAKVEPETKSAKVNVGIV